MERTDTSIDMGHDGEYDDETESCAGTSCRSRLEPKEETFTIECLCRVVGAVRDIIRERLIVRVVIEAVLVSGVVGVVLSGRPGGGVTLLNSLGRHLSSLLVAERGSTYWLGAVRGNWISEDRIREVGRGGTH